MTVKSNDNYNPNNYPQGYIIKKGSQVLYAVGIAHTHNPNHPQFKKIKQLWQRFLTSSDSKYSLVLIEGGDWPVMKTAKEAISKWGELTFIKHLAWKAGFEAFSPEPSDLAEIKELLKKFSRDEIMYYYFSRMAAQWQRSDRSFNFDSYVSLQRYRSITGWRDYDFSYKRFIQMHNQQNDHKFDKNHCSECLIGYNSSSWNVAEASSEIRDRHIYQQIKEFWEKGLNLFLVYGSSHTKNLKARLEKLGEVYSNKS